MPLKPEVLDRLLLAKSFLSRVRFHPAGEPDRYSLAQNIIAAHDAAELAIAAICDQFNCLPQKGMSYLMNYFEPLKKARHQDQEVHAKDYFRNLNETRSLLKHQGVLPNIQQWSRVGEITFQHITKWVWDYLGLSLADLDESALITNADVKRLFDEAKACATQGEYKTALERLAMALSLVFKENAALRGLEAGRPRTEDAILVASFGVHANDFLRLQEFLPHVPSRGEGDGTTKWLQSKFGHAGNWNERNVEFCLRSFVDVAIKLQGAAWIPAALERHVLFEQQIEALQDGVEIWQEVPEQEAKSFWDLYTTKRKKVIVRVLKKGETVRGIVTLLTQSSGSSLMDALSGGATKKKDVLLVSGRTT